MNCFNKFIVIASAATMVLVGCQTASKPTIHQTEDEKTATTYPSHDNLDATLWQQRSDEVRLLQLQAYQSAAALLDSALNDPQWNALIPTDRIDEKVTISTKLPPAIIVDIDETVLNNSAYQARLIRDNLRYSPATWQQWVEEENASAIAGSIDFLSHASKRGIMVFYLSNREHDQAKATLANLRKLGFPMADDAHFLGRNTRIGGCQNSNDNKSCRRQFIGKNYRVIMQFGDQLGDFIEVADNSLLARKKAVDTYANWIGTRWFILPNPTYGSWQAAAMGNPNGLSDNERRARKYQALEFR